MVNNAFGKAADRINRLFVDSDCLDIEQLTRLAPSEMVSVREAEQRVDQEARRLLDGHARNDAMFRDALVGWQLAWEQLIEKSRPASNVGAAQQLELLEDDLGAKAGAP